jgi:type IV pilus assembly protein PilQ
MRFPMSMICAVLCSVVMSAQQKDTTITGVTTPDSSTVTKIQPVAEILPKAAYDTTTISFKDTDLRDIFRALAREHGLNIFVDNSIVRKTTIALNGVPAYEAIKFLCEQNNVILTVEGGIFKIMSPPPPVIVKEEPKIPIVLFDKGNISLEVKNADLELLVLAIQNKTNKNILVTSGTSGTVTGRLIDIEFDLGFTQLMNNNGFAVQKKNNIYIISKLEYFVGNQTGPQARKAGPYWISVKDSLVNIDVTNAPLERVITDMTRQLNTDVVFYNDVTGTVTARATNVVLSKALDFIFRNTNFTYRFADGMYFVGEKSNKAMVTTRLLKLKYLISDKFLDIVPQSISSQATLKVMKEHNGIIAIAPGDVISQLEDFIAQVDVPVAQVLIEALVVDYDLSDGKDFGVKAGVRNSTDTTKNSGDMYIPGIDLLFGNKAVNSTLNSLGKQIGVANLGTLPTNFYLNIKALEEKGIANVRSRPLLATVNGHQASLSIGTTQYYILKSTIPYRDQTQTLLQESQAFQTIEANVKLELTPYVGANGLITVEIKPDFKTPVGQLSPDIPPTINQRTMSSTVIVREGETIVLGGLIQDIESESRSQIPLLGDIPLIGAVFSSTSKTKKKTELIIYVTTHISYGEAFKVAGLPNGEGDN